MKPGIVQVQNEHNRENQLCQEKFCMNVIVLVYTNDLTIQDIMFTDQSVTTIAFHKGRFKATSCETWEKRIFIFFLIFFYNERIGNSYPERYRQNPRSFSRPRMTKWITPLESSREI